MSNKRKLRAARKDERRQQPEPGYDLSLRQVRTALYQGERRGLVRRRGLEQDEQDRRRYQTWGLTALAKNHGYYHGVTVTVQSRRETAAGLLKARLAQASGLVRQGHLVRIVHPPTGSEGTARVRRVVERTALMFLEAHWGATLEKPRTRTQADARRDARANPEPCATCGAETGSDCVTRDGKRAAWPHAGRDPMLSPQVVDVDAS